MAVSDFSPTSAIIGAVSSLAGNVLNVNAQREQRDYDRRFWYEQQRYNSPVNQVARLRQAGLNPSLAMQNGAIDSGNISSLPNAHEPPQYDFSPIAQGMQNDLALQQQKRLNDAEIDSKHATTENQRIKNRYENSQQLASLFDLLSRGNLSKENQKLVQKQILRLDKELDWYDRDVESQINLRTSEKAVQDSQLAINNVILEFKPKEQQALLEVYKAQKASLYSAARDNDASALLKAAEEAVAKAREQGVIMDNEQKARVMESMIDEAIANKRKAEAEAILSERSVRQGSFLGRYVPDVSGLSFDTSPYEDKLVNGIKKLWNGYKKGVQRGIEKSRHK